MILLEVQTVETYNLSVKQELLNRELGIDRRVVSSFILRLATGRGMHLFATIMYLSYTRVTLCPCFCHL